MIKILLAVDGSATASRAAHQLVRSAAWYKEPPEVHLTTAHLEVPMLGRVSSALGHHAVEQYYREESEQALAEARGTIRAAGLKCVEHTEIGEPAERIVRIAKTTGCDLIYMGTRGLSTVKALVLGSTAQKVVHLADIPVVLVPPG
jgi:nucleotide-binding universal stress UspA family protein